MIGFQLRGVRIKPTTPSWKMSTVFCFPQNPFSVWRWWDKKKDTTTMRKETWATPTILPSFPQASKQQQQQRVTARILSWNSYSFYRHSTFHVPYCCSFFEINIPKKGWMNHRSSPVLFSAHSKQNQNATETTCISCFFWWWLHCAMSQRWRQWHY